MRNEKPVKVQLKFKGVEKATLESVARSLNVSRANVVRAATLRFLGVKEEGTPKSFM
jgi:hypothetical protein